jgi:phosphoserine phosphatase RsbU/P
LTEETFTIDQLQRKLSLNQLQLNRLLEITHAINNNMKIDGLFKMYNSFLSWELGVKNMALYIIEENKWGCSTKFGDFSDEETNEFSAHFAKYKKTEYVKEDKLLATYFEVIIPVYHKEEPIAYSLIGGIQKEEESFNKIQYITTITNIIAVAIENKRLFKRQVEQQTMNREMQLARDMQLQLIPEKLPVADSFQLSSIYLPNMAVGGDYFDCIAIDDSKMLFVIADISGKGLSAALLMSNLQANLHALVNKQDTNLEQLVIKLNVAIKKITKGEKYLTLFVSIFDTTDNSLTYINAGHIPPILAYENDFSYLEKGTTIIGIFEDLDKIETTRLIIKKPSLLVLFTDGITDIKNETGKYFNQENIFEFVKTNNHLHPQRFNEELMATVNRFKGEENEFPDDITVLTCRFL